MPAIVFDFDGVIVDSEPVHEAALLEAARTLGMSFSHRDYLDELIGYDDRDFYPALCRLNGRRPTAAEFASFFAHKKPAVRRALEGGAARPYDGSIALARAAADRGVPLAICSGALRDEIEVVLDRLGIASLFATIVSADEVVRSKPDPEGYALAASRLGVAPSSCVAIEDTPTGCKAALAAGLRVIAVGHSLPEDVFPAGVERFAESSQDLRLDEILEPARG